MRNSLLIAAAVAVACGSASSPPSRSAAPGFDAGSVSGGVDAGPVGNADAGTSGGDVDAGTTGGGSPDAGSGNSGSADAGTSGSDGGSGGGGADAGTGSADAGTADAGTTASDCDGIMPAGLGASTTVTAPPGFCGGPATSDQEGNVALAGSSQSWWSFSWATYSAAGQPLGQIAQTGGLVPLDRGFQGVKVWTGAGAPMDLWHLWTWAPDGTGTSTSVGSDACSVGANQTSTSGAVVLSSCGSGVNGDTRAIRFDQSGRQLSSTFLHVYTGSAAMGDTNGLTLVAAYPGTSAGFGQYDLVGRWLAADGDILTPWFVIAAGGTSAFSMQALIGGGVAVMQDEAWRAVVPSGVAAAQTPPAWLRDRPARDLFIVRGRRAYALTQRGGAPAVEVVSPSGKTCGTLDLSGSSASVGGDGTLITITGNGGCTRTWWPAVLGVQR